MLQSSVGHMAYYLGIDIGSVSVKLCLIDESGHPLRRDSEKVSTGPRAAVSTLIDRVAVDVSLRDVVAVGLSGSGSSAIPAELGWAA